jgi:hypothetical protein
MIIRSVMPNITKLVHQKGAESHTAEITWCESHFLPWLPLLLCSVWSSSLGLRNNWALSRKSVWVKCVRLSTRLRRCKRDIPNTALLKYSNAELTIIAQYHVIDLVHTAVGKKWFKTCPGKDWHMTGTHMQTCMWKCVHTHIYVHIHTHTHIYTNVHGPP